MEITLRDKKENTHQPFFRRIFELIFKLFCFEGAMSQINNQQEVSLRDVVLKIKQVVELTSLSQATIYRYLNDPNSDFPPRKKLGAGRVGWLASAINNYITSRPDVR